MPQIYIYTHICISLSHLYLSWFNVYICCCITFLLKLLHNNIFFVLLVACYRFNKNQPIKIDYTIRKCSVNLFVVNLRKCTFLMKLNLFYWKQIKEANRVNKSVVTQVSYFIIVRRAGLLWSQQDFEWRRSVPLFKCLTVLEFSFILFDLCLLITFFIFIMNYVPIVTFWIFTYHKIWILSIMFCSIWSYWIIYFLACLEVSWRVVS